MLLALLAACGHEGVQPETVPGKDEVPGGTVINLVRVDPLEKIFQEQTAYDAYGEAEDLARGETATFQFVLKSDTDLSEVSIVPGDLKCIAGSIPFTLKAREKYTRAGFHLEPAADDAMFPASDQYPDCLDESEIFDVAKNKAVPLWVSYRIPEDCEAGDYSATVAVTGKISSGEDFRVESKISVKIYDVTIREQNLLVSNWHAHKFIPMIGNGMSVPIFSDLYYDLLTEMVHVMRDHGQNVYWLNPLSDYIKATRSGDDYVFDFKEFDRTVQLYIDEGNLKRIEGGHLARRSGNWESDYWVTVPDKGGLFPLSDPAAQKYLSSLIPALKKHLSEKGWWDIYLQHIGDEPAGPSVKSYIEIANFVKDLAPDLTILDAVHSKDLGGTVDVWCPELDHFEEDYSFYKQRKAAGDQLWYYTCMAPRGNYANRFLELPLIKTRLLHWINFRYGATGYLHWGFNQDWTEALRWIATDNYCPGGDTYIVYPGPGKVYSSIRLEAMRDGINDYELLRMLARKDPSMANGLAANIILDFGAYNTDKEAFRATRRTLLLALEGETE